MTMADPHRRVAVLAFVRRYYAARGCGPALRQIAAAVGVSTATAAYHVDQLVSEGRLSRSPGASRTLRPVLDVPQVAAGASSARVTVSGSGPAVDVYRFVRRYVTDHGFGPTMREIAAGVGVGSTSTVAYHVRRLVFDGLLTRREGSGAAVARSLRPTEFREVA